MKLAAYLKKKNLTHEKFASLTGVSKPQITRVINKTRNPSVRLIEAIKKVTNGEVTYEDLINPKKEDNG